MGGDGRTWEEMVRGYIRRFWGLRGHIVDQHLIRNGAQMVPDAIWKDLEGSGGQNGRSGRARRPSEAWGRGPGAEGTRVFYNFLRRNSTVYTRTVASFGVVRWLLRSGFRIVRRRLAASFGFVRPRSASFGFVRLCSASVGTVRGSRCRRQVINTRDIYEEHLKHIMSNNEKMKIQYHCQENM